MRACERARVGASARSVVNHGSVIPPLLSRAFVCSRAGIMFLSGGQSEEDASVTLSWMNRLETKKPWNLSFSYGRALQQSVLQAWKGKKENVAAAQAALQVRARRAFPCVAVRLSECVQARARANSEATRGTYGGGAGGGAAGSSLHVAGYTY